MDLQWRRWCGRGLAPKQARRALRSPTHPPTHTSAAWLRFGSAAWLACRARTHPATRRSPRSPYFCVSRPQRAAMGTGPPAARSGILTGAATSGATSSGGGGGGNRSRRGEPVRLTGEWAAASVALAHSKRAAPPCHSLPFAAEQCSCPSPKRVFRADDDSLDRAGNLYIG